MVKSSQHLPILEPANLKAAVKDPIAKQDEKGDLGSCHYPKLSPVNLDENFVAANAVGVGNHLNPESPYSDSEMCVMFGKPVGYLEVSNYSLEKYSLAEAWKMAAGVTSHSKFSGRSTSTHMFLYPEFHFVTCFFPSIFNTYLHWRQELHKQVLQHQCLARWQLYCRVCNFAVSLCTFL